MFLVPALAPGLLPGPSNHSLDETGVFEGNWGNIYQLTLSSKALTEFLLKRSVAVTRTRDFPRVVVLFLVPLHAGSLARGEIGVNLATSWLALAPVGESSEKMIPLAFDFLPTLTLLYHALSHVDHRHVTRAGHQEHLLSCLFLVLHPLHIFQAGKHARCRQTR